MTENKYTRDEMLAKIQKLMSLANDPNANEHVAAQAAAKAQQWMQEWAISEAEATQTKGGPPTEPMVTVQTPMPDGKHERWSKLLLVSVARATMTYVFIHERPASFTFVGRETDVKVAIYMYLQLYTRLRELSRLRLSDHGAEMKHKFGKSIYSVAGARALSGCHPTVYRQRWLDSWLLGARAGIDAALEAQRVQTAATHSTALVVIETRTQEAEAWAKSRNTIKDGRPTRAVLVFGAARTAGYNEGRKMQIQAGLEDNGSPLALKGE